MEGERGGAGWGGGGFLGWLIGLFELSTDGLIYCFPVFELLCLVYYVISELLRSALIIHLPGSRAHAFTTCIDMAGVYE